MTDHRDEYHYRMDSIEVQTPFVVRQIVASLVRERIARGFMPKNLDQLLDSRGSVEDAAADLAKFSGYPYEACLSAITETYT